MVVFRCITVAYALTLAFAIDVEDGVSLLQKHADLQHDGIDKFEDNHDEEDDGDEYDFEMSGMAQMAKHKCKASCGKNAKAWKKKCKKNKCKACPECGGPEAEETVWPQVQYALDFSSRPVHYRCGAEKAFKVKDQLECQAKAVERGHGYIEMNLKNGRCNTCEKFYGAHTYWEDPWQVFRNPASCSSFPSQNTCPSSFCRWQANSCLELYELTAKGASCGSEFEHIISARVCTNAATTLGLVRAGGMDHIKTFGCIQDFSKPQFGYAVPGGIAAVGWGYMDPKRSVSAGADYAMVCIRRNSACQDDDQPCQKASSSSYCELDLEGLTGQQQCLTAALDTAVRDTSDLDMRARKATICYSTRSDGSYTNETLWARSNCRSTCELCQESQKQS